MRPPASLKNRPPVSRYILLAGFVAGTLDITAASIQYFIRTGKGPGGVLRYVASAIFGKKAFAGGLTMAAWGLLFHYIIAFIFTIFFFSVYSLFKPGRWNPFVTGLGYGVFVWLIMNLVVVPIAIGSHPIILKKAAIAMAILMVCIGLPVSLIAGRYYSLKKAA